MFKLIIPALLVGFWASAQSVSYPGRYYSGRLLDSSAAALHMTQSGEFVNLEIEAPHARCVMKFQPGQLKKTGIVNSIFGKAIHYSLYQFAVAQYCSSEKIFGPTALLTIYKNEDGSLRSVLLKSAILSNKFRYFETR